MNTVYAWMGPNGFLSSFVMGGGCPILTSFLSEMGSLNALTGLRLSAFVKSNF